MTYPLPNLTLNPGYLGIVTWSNGIVDGLYGIAILITIFFTCFYAAKAFSSKKAFIGASWICMISSVFLFIMGLIQDYIMYGTIILFLLALGIWNFLQQD